jgi:endonuclease/exonuclease/phosphatase family metal-dependent hydrolase
MWSRRCSALALVAALIVGLLALAPASAAPKRAAKPVTLVTLNLLHGLFCDEGTDNCQAPDRVAIFGEQVEAAGCPDLVGIQEVGTRLEQLLTTTVPQLCNGAYEVAWAGSTMPDRVMVLSRLPVVDDGELDIANVPWEAYWVRVRSPQGPVDFLTAHFASSSNNPACTSTLCPTVCPTGIETNECHGIQVADFLTTRRGAALSVVAGDLNATPGEATVAHLRDAGFVDGWPAAGKSECDATHREGCTAGGTAPEPWVGMNTQAGAGFDERIDYVWVKPGRGCKARVKAKGFATTPRATPLNGMWWPSDHGGVYAAVRCS